MRAANLPSSSYRSAIGEAPRGSSSTSIGGRIKRNSPRASRSSAIPYHDRRWRRCASAPAGSRPSVRKWRSSIGPRPSLCPGTSRKVARRTVETPSSWARCDIHSARRLRPTPASPEMSTSRARPSSVVRLSSSQIRSRSWSRSTNGWARRRRSPRPAPARRIGGGAGRGCRQDGGVGGGRLALGWGSVGASSIADKVRRRVASIAVRIVVAPSPSRSSNVSGVPSSARP